MPPVVGPEIKKTFAIPELLLRRIPKKAYPPREEKAAVLTLGLKIDAIVFRFADAGLAAKAWAGFMLAFGQHGLIVDAVHGAPTGGFDYAGPVMVLKEAKAEKECVGEDNENFQSLHHGIIHTDLEVLGRFSRATGLRVRYCFGGAIIPPYPHEEGTLNVITGARPPGNFETHEQMLQTIFGLSIWSKDESRWVHSPTAWRGRVIAAEGTPLIQLVGNNAYQLVLYIGAESNNLNRSRIWEELLALLSREQLAEHAETPAEPTPEEFDRDIQAMASQRYEELRKSHSAVSLELMELEKRLAEKMRERANHVTCLQALENDTVDLADRSKADFERLRGMKDDITAVRLSAEHGLLAETVPIILERGGRRYDLGPFRIHVAPKGQVAVWSEAPRHPKGHHHPHVDKTSLECFGNITLSVLKLTLAYRLADAIELVMRWLRTYRPELTLIPLEEFPSEPIATKGTSRGKKEKRAESLRPAQPARSEGSAPGDADRRRLDRKPRRLRARQDGRAEAPRVGRR